MEQKKQTLTINKDGLQILDPEPWRRKTYSPTAISKLNQCPASWAVSYLDETTPGPTDPRTIGTTVHEICETLCFLPPEQRTRHMAKTLLDGWENTPSDKTLAWEKLEKWWEAENPSNINLYDAEIEITTTIESVPIHGFIDRVDITAKGHHIGDYKTSGPKKARPNPQHILKYGDDYGDQITLYWLAWKTLHPDIEMDPAAHLIFTGVGVKRTIRQTKTTQNRAIENMQVAAATHQGALTSGLLPYQPSGLCPWCPLCAQCPATSKTPVTEGITLPTHPPVVNIPPVGAPYKKQAEPTPPPQNKEQKKMIQTHSWIEAKPWEDPTPTTSPNAASYRTQGMFGIVELAAEKLIENGKMSTPNLSEASRLLKMIVERTQQQITGKTPDLGSGLSTRIRGALRTALIGEKIPVGLTGTERRIFAERIMGKIVSIEEATWNLLTSEGATR